MLLLNSPTLDTTKEVPNSVHAINWVDFGSLIILEGGIIKLASSCEPGSSAKDYRTKKGDRMSGNECVNNA
jgi:hypothetical protein